MFDGRVFLDSALTYSGTASDTFQGLDHLNGRTVTALVDDTDVYEVEVAGGQITLPEGVTATSLVVGYPFTSTVRTVRPEIATPAGTSQFLRKSWAWVGLRVFCTRGTVTLANEDGQTEPVAYPPDTDTSQPFTGDLARKERYGWGTDGILVVQHADPLPFTLQGITGSMQLENP